MKNFRYIVAASILLLCGCLGNSSDGNGGATPNPLNSTDIGNGGDLIECQKQMPQFPYEDEYGWYVLDYAENRGPKYLYFEEKTLEEYIEHFKKLLEFAAPELMVSFESYLAGIPFMDLREEEQHQELGEILRLWVPTEKNEEINDEDPSFIPFNCRMSGTKLIKLHQVVVRQEFTDADGVLGRIDYYYDQALLDKIGDKPLQLSMLIIHEWLWDMYQADNSRGLREANRMFHSPRSVGLPAAAIRKLLNLTHEEGGNPKLPKKPLRP